MRGSVALVASVLSPALAACYLPVKYTEPASPKLIGVYRRADGSLRLPNVSTCLAARA